MATTTTVYSFTLPSVGGDDDAWGAYLDANWNALDLLFANTFDSPAGGALGKLKSSLIPSPITTQVAIANATAPQLKVQRLGDDVNARIWCVGQTGIGGVQFGLGDANLFAVGPEGSLGVAEGLRKFWVNVSTGGIAWEGPALGIGSGITNLNASNLATGTVPDARLPTTVAGKTFSSGIELSGGAVSTVGDFSKQIKLHPAGYGFDIRSNNFDIVSSASGQVNFAFGSTVEAFIDNAGGFFGSAFHFDTDTDTGIERPGANILAVFVGGAEKMRVSAGGVTTDAVGGFIGVGTNLTSLNASQLDSGTVDPDRLPTNASERNRVLALLAGASAGGVGTCATLCRSASNAAVTWGGSYAGSALRQAGLWANNENTNVVSNSTALSGTWMALCDADAQSGRNSGGVFLRIA